MEEPVNSMHDIDVTFPYKDFLKEWMDPDFGLLDKLRARNALTEEEIDEIKARCPYRERNLKLIHFILLKQKFKELIEALRDASQTHLANYLIGNGEHKPEFGGDWPLGKRELSIIAANTEYLVDFLDTRDVLIPLFSAWVINKRQKEFIDSKRPSYKKNEELLKILRRSSLGNYWQTIKCLRASNQSHIADIFEKGGVVVQTDAALDAVGVDVKEADEQIVTGITNVLGSRSLPESNRILELVKLRLIGAKVDHSVALYFHCLELREVDRLQEICESGFMKDIVETVFKRLLKTNANIQVTIKWAIDGFNWSPYFHNAFDPSKEEHERGKTHRGETTINDLPLELMDLILEKSYLSFLHIENESRERIEKQDLISKMASVDWCWFQRLKRRRWKRRIWRQVTSFCKETDKFAFYRINRYYLVENILPTVLISLLRSADCLTDVQARLLNRQKHRKDKTKRDNTDINADLLHVLRSFNTDTRYSDFIRCLRQSNQNVVATIAQKGGAVVKAKIVIRKRIKQEQVVQQQLLVQGLNCLKDKTRSRAAELDKLMFQLTDDQTEILNSFPDRQAVAWVWCRSQIAFENLRSQDEQHGLVKLVSCLTKNPQSAAGKTHETNQRQEIDIDIDQFKKEIVLFPTIVNFTASLEDDYLMGVTKLRNEIYVLCLSFSSPNAIYVFQDINPFQLKRKIEIKNIKCPEDIVSSERVNCLYVIDTGSNYVWKIVRDADNDYRTIEWLSIGIDWSPTLSVSRDSHLLIVRGSGPLSRLEIYGTDANLRLSICLPQDIQFPQQAMETSTGNFVILHDSVQENTDSSGICTEIWKIWEVTRNGEMVIRCFIPQDMQQELCCFHLSIDSDDRVFVADSCRVIVLDSDLRWNRTLIEEESEPRRLCYDDENKQLIVLSPFRGFGLNIYSFK